jgi:hypothetical protein
MNAETIKAVDLLTAADCTFSLARHGRRVELLAAVLRDHPDARVEYCADEKTGSRYGNAACRKGRAVKIGYTSFQTQWWAVW